MDKYKHFRSFKRAVNKKNQKWITFRLQLNFELATIINIFKFFEKKTFLVFYFIFRKEYFCKIFEDGIINIKNKNKRKSNENQKFEIFASKNSIFLPIINSCSWRIYKLFLALMFIKTCLTKKWRKYSKH